MTCIGAEKAWTRWADAISFIMNSGMSQRSNGAGHDFVPHRRDAVSAGLMSRMEPTCRSSVQNVRWASLGTAHAPSDVAKRLREDIVSIVWTIVIGFLAGVIAKFLTPGSNEPAGFVLTTILGIIGAFVATYLGQALHWYAPGEGAGLIGAVVGAVIVLMAWAFLANRRHTV